MKIYLAIPYSGMEQESFVLANHIAAKLMREGHIVYSPISHAHPIAMQEHLPTGWEYWAKTDKEFIRWCDKVCLIRKAGWRKSKGVQAELQLASTLKKDVVYLPELIK